MQTPDQLKYSLWIFRQPEEEWFHHGLPRNHVLREKLLAYTAIPSLRHYLIINQEKAEVFHYQRGGTGWTDLTLTAGDGRIVLPELDFSLTMAGLYEESGIAFSSRE